MNLCHFSKSEIHSDAILPDCPLALSSAQAKFCLCKKRLYHVPPADLRVLSCTFPNDFRGEPIRDVAALQASIEARRPSKKTKRSKEPKIMTTGVVATEDTIQGKPTTALTLSFYDKMTDPLASIQAIGKDIADCGMFGDSVTPATGRVLALACLSERKSPMELIQKYHLIKGRLSMRADFMHAEFNRRGWFFQLVERSPTRAAILIGKSKKEAVAFEFTWEEARLEKYVYNGDANIGKIPLDLPNGAVNPSALKENWSTATRRKQMLWARCVSDAVRAVAPEINSGSYTPEELDAPIPQDDGVIDAEFEVVPADKPKPTETAPVQQPSPSHPEVAVSAGSVAKTEPLAMDTAEPGQPKNTKEQRLEVLKFIKPLVERHLTDIQVKAVLQKYGVTKFSQLEDGDLDRVREGLVKREQKYQRQAGTDELSQWADKAAHGGK